MCCGLLLLCMSLSTSVWAAQWVVVPRLSVQEIYTDNVELSDEDQAESKFITEISPGVSVQAEGRRLQLSLNYFLRSSTYNFRTDAGDLFHQLRGNAQVEIARDLFYVDVQGSQSRRRIDPSIGNIPSFAYLGEGFTNVSVVEVAPYLAWNIGSDALGELRYRVNRVTYSDVRRADGQIDELSMFMHSTPNQARFYWEYRYGISEVRYDNGSEATLEDGYVNLYIPLGYRVSFILRPGYERNEYRFGSAQSVGEGNYWAAGIRWDSGREIYIQMLSGERYYGSNQSLELRYEGAKIEIGAEYDEYVESQIQSQIRRAVYGSAVTEEGSEFALPSVESDVYLTERFGADVLFRHGRNEITMSIYDQQRTSQISTYAYRAKGGRLRLSRSLSSTITSAIDLSGYERVYRADSRTDRRNEYGIELSKAFNSRLDGNLTFVHYRQNSTLAAYSYRENRVTATMSMTF